MTVLDLIGAALLCGALSAQAPKPHIVFVLADDLGWTDLSTGRTNRGNGSDYYRTPNIDALAERGVSFDHAYTCGPNCTPTRAALMSGLYAARTGVYTASGPPPADNRRLDPALSSQVLPTEIVTLVDRIRDAGYATGHFGKWHLGNDPFYGPLGQGFDVNAGGTSAAIVTGGGDGHFAQADGSWDLPNLPANGMPGQYMAERLTDEAIAWMDGNKHGPFLCWLAHFSVHRPIQAPATDIAAFDGVPRGAYHGDQVYAGMLKNLDDNIGRLVRFLEDTDDPQRPGSKLISNTVIVFTSDNGGLGGYATAGIVGAHEVTHQFPLRSGKGSMYEGGIRVPLIVRWDGQVAPGTIQSTPVQSVDFVETLVRIAGGPGLEEGIDGVDLVPLLRGEVRRLERTTLFWHFPAYVVASAALGTWIETPASVIRRDDWKMRFAYETRTWELYDLATDPGENIDLVGQRTDVALALGTELREWLSRTDAALPLILGTSTPVPLPGAPGAGDGVDWRLLANVASPPPLDAAVAGSSADGMLLFGGQGAAGVSDALWRFDGQTWEELAPANRPAARRGHAGCWDPIRARLLVFGGVDANVTRLGDSWLLDGVDGQQLATSGAPSPREASALVFDSARGVAVLFGGRDSSGPLADTWELDGLVWRQHSTATVPPPRSGHGMIFDPASGRTLLFGGAAANGAPLDDTWVFDGVDWQQLAAAGAPPARTTFAFAWDAARERAVLFGGCDADGLALADTWEFDGAQWRERTPAHPPLALAGAVAVFDRAGERIVVFGGRNGARFAATWDYAPAFAASATVFGAGCQGSAGTPALTPGARPWLGSAFTAELAPLRDGGAAALLLGFSNSAWAGGSLPFSLAIVGAPGCDLWVSPDVTFALAVASGSAPVRLLVPASTTLLGKSFYVQGIAHDPTANAFGFVISDAIAARIGAR